MANNNNNTFDNVKLQFEKFLSSIGNILTSENEINIIQNKLRRHFNTATSNYLCSDEFRLSLEHMKNMFVENNKSRKYFTLLASFDEQLKKHSIKSPRLNLPSIQVPISSSLITTTMQSPQGFVEVVLQDSIEPIIDYQTVVQETIEYLLERCCSIVSELDVPIDANPRVKHQRKIIKLERRLSRLSRTIRELEEKDMSLDEMVHCDLYVVESNLKKQAYEIHTKLAELKSQSASIDRIIHQPITLNESETGHPLLNADLQEMVNQSKHFPSFNDVLQTVEKSTDKHKLHLNEEARRTFAEKSFKVIGKEIKNRRMADFNDILYSRLPEDFNIEKNDPALNSTEIEKVLIENEREANIKTEKIFEEFSRIEPNPDAEVDIRSSEEEESAAESEEQQEEMDTVVDSHDIQYDIVDIVPLHFADPLTPIEAASNSAETPVEISLNDRTFTILSTASLPTKRSNYSRDSAAIEPPETDVQTLTPRHKQTLTSNEIIYKLYREKLTNKTSTVSNSTTKKRPLIKNNELFNAKKSKEQTPELIVLD